MAALAVIMGTRAEKVDFGFCKMILFIFEGTKREPRLFKTLEYLFFPKNCEHIVCSYGNNIYNLYKRMSETDFDEDIVAILMEKYREEGVGSFAGIEKRSDISEVYLFFDYDIHNQNLTKTLALCDLNEQLQKMLDFFTDETEHGKLYINYPMSRLGTQKNFPTLIIVRIKYI